MARTTSKTDEITPYRAFSMYRAGNGNPDWTWLEGVTGVRRQKLYAFDDPTNASYRRHRPRRDDAAAIATFLNMKMGTRFTSEDVCNDFVARGGVIAKERKPRTEAQP